MALYGKANYDKTTFQQLAFYQLKSKPTPVVNLVLRLAPPIKEAAEKGVWALPIKSHFGYKLKITKKDRSTFEAPQTFLCTEKTDRNKNIIQECPECNEVSLFTEKVKKLKERFKAEGKTDDEIAELTKTHTKWLREHNRDMKWHILAKDLSGKWGILKISHSLKQKLDDKIKELVSKNIDPLSPEKGIWFEFKRADPDNWKDPRDTVNVVMEEFGDGSMRYKFDSLTKADDEQLDKMPELHTLGRKLSIEQIKLLVESQGDEDTVKSVFGAFQQRQSSEEESPAETKQQEPVVAKASDPVEDDEEAKLLATLAALRAKKLDKVGKVEVKTEPPKSQKASGPQDMESFIALFENDNSESNPD